MGDTTVTSVEIVVKNNSQENIYAPTQKWTFQGSRTIPISRP